MRPLPLTLALLTLIVGGAFAAISVHSVAQPTVQQPPRRPGVTPAPTQAAPRDYPRVEYQADLRPFVFNGGLTNKSGRLYGEHPAWAIGQPGTIYDHLDLGLDRTILRQPVGPGVDGWVLFSSWHPLSNAQRLDFANGVREWKGEKHSRSVGVFFGRDATDPFVRRDVGIAEGPLIRLDPLDPQALLWWIQNTQPLVDIGVDQFWLDRGSAHDNPETQRAIVRLARRVRLLQGVKIGVEAVPQRRNKEGQVDRSLGPDWDYMTKVPAMGRWRYFWNAWIKHGYADTLAIPEELRGPNGIEVHVFFHPNDNPPPTTGDLLRFQEWGYVISWLNSIQQLPEGEPTNP